MFTEDDRVTKSKMVSVQSGAQSVSLWAGSVCVNRMAFCDKQIQKALKFDPIKEVVIVVSIDMIRSEKLIEVLPDLKSLIKAIHLFESKIEGISEADTLDEEQIIILVHVCIKAGNISEKQVPVLRVVMKFMAKT